MTDTGTAAATAQRSRWRHNPAGTPCRSAGVDRCARQPAPLPAHGRDRASACSHAESPRSTHGRMLCWCARDQHGSTAVMTSRSPPRGAPGGGMSRRSWLRRSLRIWPSLRTPRSPAAGSGTPRPTRPTAGPADAAGRGRRRSAGSRPVTSAVRRCGDLSRSAGRAHRRAAIHAVLFYQGAPALGEGTLRTGQGLASAGGRGRPPVAAGQLQVATAQTRSRRWRPGCTSCATS